MRLPADLEADARAGRRSRIDEPGVYLGGNGGSYMMYDPCKGTTRYFPVSASRLEFIGTVDCSPASKQEH